MGPRRARNVRISSSPLVLLLLFTMNPNSGFQYAGHCEIMYEIKVMCKIIFYNSPVISVNNRQIF